MDFVHTIADFIHRHSLLRKDGMYLVALSGGADSVAMMLALQQLGYRIEAAHCNFRLRGEESDRDESFCKKLCHDRGIPFHLVHFDTRAYAALHQVSIEMAARDLRYPYFEHLRKDILADGICVAHHRDDSVETVLMNLIRGTGIHGLTGIAPQNGYVLRPLLCVSRNEILAFLSSIHQDFVTDSTNLVDDVTRNKIRLDVLPLLETINPSVKENIAKTADRIGESVKMVDHVLDDAKARLLQETVKGRRKVYSVDIGLLQQEISPEYTLFYLLKDFSFSSAQIEQIASHLDAPTGTMWHSANYDLLLDRGKILWMAQEPVSSLKMRIPEEGTYRYQEGKPQDGNSLRFQFKKVAIDDKFSLVKDQAWATLDADKVTFPLTIRHLQEGDRFIPFGMRGSRLVSDFLTDRKYSLFEKQAQLVITDAHDYILWLVGLRPDARYSIKDGSRRALTIHVTDEPVE
ncbi:MAG: tRNA lysidine(34) synthetase TilS [Prevotella sp.]|jgi:tRNA(Ile)-lysidine synthase|nr:tRNA lysidine(34) synthetase TilS [Prevotella sp.]MCI2079923.1 tRNA lysidine(34) synthetase TilS [Prevotella sp.]MCI2101761.1 tRNA lysidine(34) synthetase TilS [Prevotella sp.]